MGLRPETESHLIHDALTQYQPMRGLGSWQSTNSSPGLVLWVRRVWWGMLTPLPWPCPQTSSNWPIIGRRWGLTDQSEAREPPCGGEINHPSQEPSASDGPETVRRWGDAPLANQRPERGQVTNQRPEWGRVTNVGHGVLRPGVAPGGSDTGDEWSVEWGGWGTMTVQVSSFCDYIEVSFRCHEGWDKVLILTLFTHCLSLHLSQTDYWLLQENRQPGPSEKAVTTHS